MRFSIQRRQVLVGMASAAAASIATPVLSGTLASSRGSLTGVVVRTIYEPHKLLTLLNSSDQPIVIDQFENKALKFDGELVDCNAACTSEPIVVPANSEIRIHFDKRKIASRASDFHNLESRVQRLSQGTRVVPIQLDVTDGFAKLAA